MVSFFETERNAAGWRFLILWIVASAAGFLPGTALEILLFDNITLWFGVPLAAFGQGWVLNRHISVYLPWTLGTALIWIIAVALASGGMSLMDMSAIAVWIRLATIAAIAGAAVGVLQWWLLQEWLPQIGIWWIVVSALSWASFMPGVITGFVLMWSLDYTVVPMNERRYELSGDF